MKIPARQDLSLGENERIICSRPCFNFKRRLRLRQGIAHRPMHLRHAAQTIGILDARVVMPMRLANLALLQQRAQMRRHRHLPRMRPHSVNALIKRRRRSLQRFKRHRASQV